MELKFIKKKKLKGPNPLSVKRKMNKTKAENDENADILDEHRNSVQSSK